MNKAVIKKFKAEFDWWLDGDEVLVKSSKYPHDDIWQVVNVPNWDDNLYVINDEYVEYRKALAEGKTIQFTIDRGVTWRDCQSETLVGPVKEYRIKPDEPVFKVGDYVVNIPKDCTQLLDKPMEHGEHFKLWTLEDASDDEWVLLKFNGESNYSIMKVRNAKKSSPTSQLSVVPYIGQTPVQLGLEK